MDNLPEAVEEVLARLEAAGYEAWCVGGAVRDLLLGRTPGDWDVTTDAEPEAALALFAPNALPTGLKHGTVTVKSGGQGVEVTTFRRDGDYLDGRHPEHVTFTRSLREDLARRDFTVNAIAMDRRGALADPFRGREDLAAGVLRAVGEPEKRFQEDALRILRGLRFASRLGFAVELGTAEALRRCAPLLGRIAPERIHAELTGILCGDHVLEVLLAYPDVLGVFLPEILPCVGFDQRSVYHCYDVWEHTARAVAASPPVPEVRYALLLHDLGKPGTFSLDGEGRGHFYGHWRRSTALADGILERLRFDNQSRRTILTLVERHDCELALSERAVRRALARYGEGTLRLLLAVKRADNLAQAEPYRGRQRLLDQWEDLLSLVLEQGACFSLRQLAVKGGDLTALGLEGPAVGRALEGLLELVLDEKLPNDRAMLLEYAKEKLL
ncbi:MAG: HD domain-containing protein [Oscillospiraceae bacterium]|jgi:tRNA nucleotidyltransferase (CCA-adding enzyme)|nr:HD domain-containing protein [Oscillospiraceae bacterium]